VEGWARPVQGLDLGLCPTTPPRSPASSDTTRRHINLDLNSGAVENLNVCTHLGLPPLPPNLRQGTADTPVHRPVTATTYALAPRRCDGDSYVAGTTSKSPVCLRRPGFEQSAGAYGIPEAKEPLSPGISLLADRNDDFETGASFGYDPPIADSHQTKDRCRSAALNRCGDRSEGVVPNARVHAWGPLRMSESETCMPAGISLFVPLELARSGVLLDAR
jgi:hypothetical protein